MRKKRIAIIQSIYLPWKGYFDIIRSVDEFILYDDIQYTKRDWRNRNVIKSENGAEWLTVPVMTKGRYTQCIEDVVVTDIAWRKKHWMKIVHTYSRAPFFHIYSEPLKEMFLHENEMRLSAINYGFIRIICSFLNITTPIHFSSHYAISKEGDKTERLVAFCKAAGATEYLNGPAGKSYMNQNLFSQAGISLTWVDYSGYPEYQQFHTPFEHKVSILDLLFHTGPRALAYMKWMS